MSCLSSQVPKYHLTSCICHVRTIENSWLHLNTEYFSFSKQCVKGIRKKEKREVLPTFLKAFYVWFPDIQRKMKKHFRNDQWKSLPRKTIQKCAQGISQGHSEADIASPFPVSQFPISNEAKEIRRGFVDTIASASFKLQIVVIKMYFVFVLFDASKKSIFRTGAW